MWKKRQTGTPPSDTGSHRSLWHAVSIVTTAASCRMARGLGTIRFLAKDAPRLPLSDCNAGGACPCAYKHHTDRRHHARRMEELMGLRRPHSGKEGRQQARRASKNNV